MCIIIAKDKIGRLPTETELRNSFNYNNDGAGFMYVDNGKVVIDKGYMTVDSFIKRYHTLLNKYNNFNNKSLVIHCRIGTSGKNNKGNTHPYPITDDIKKLRTKHLTSEKIGIAHNGIIHGYGTVTGLNDTQEYISKYLYPLYKHYKDFYKNKDMLYQMELATNSKFIILDTTDTLYYVGEFTDDKGLKFSNTSYKYTYTRYDYSKTYNSDYTKYSSYKYDYDDYKYDYDDYDDSWYTDMYNKDKERYINELDNKYDNIYKTEDEIREADCMCELPKDYKVDLYSNGNIRDVGSNKYWYNFDTMELYELIGDEFKLITENPIIYDEKGEEVNI